MRRTLCIAVAAGLCGCGGGTAPQNSTLGQLPTETCSGAASSCLYGTVKTDGFSAPVISFRASLYRVFPAGSIRGGAEPQAQAVQTVAKDGTWAFSALDPWGHYYIQIVPAFATGPSRTVAARVGPLAIPSNAAPVDVQVKPVQLDVDEQGPAGNPMLLRKASAHVFDPATGNEVGQGGATASIMVGGTPTPMPWTMLLPTLSAYVADFTTLMPAPPAQPNYAITTSLNGSSSAWTLVANPPAFTPTIQSPPDRATVVAGQDLLFTWPLQPEADYETLQLYLYQSGSLPLAYASPSPNATDVNQERVPGASLATPGTYLVNLAFSKANCPSSAGGCVYSSTVRAQQLIVK